MPISTYTNTFPVSHKDIWSFISDINNWAPLVPGYMSHEVFNDFDTIWKFKSDLGVVKKTIELKVHIIEWKEPTQITFEIEGLSNRFHGSGFFHVIAVNVNSTRITGNIDIKGTGSTGPMKNQLFKSFIPKLTEELTEAVGTKAKTMKK